MTSASGLGDRKVSRSSFPFTSSENVTLLIVAFLPSDSPELLTTSLEMGFGVSSDSSSDRPGEPSHLLADAEGVGATLDRPVGVLDGLEDMMKPSCWLDGGHSASSCFRIMTEDASESAERRSDSSETLASCAVCLRLVGVVLFKVVWGRLHGGSSTTCAAPSSLSSASLSSQSLLGWARSSAFFSSSAICGLLGGSQPNMYFPRCRPLRMRPSQGPSPTYV